MLSVTAVSLPMFSVLTSSSREKRSSCTRNRFLLCKDEEELILVQLADDAAVSREILVQLALDQSSEKRLTNGFGTLQDFFVIIHVDQTENNLTVFDFRERLPDVP